MDSTIDCLKECKSLCEFNATDFKANKVKLYQRTRQMMAAKYATENYFGPLSKEVAKKPVKEMSTEEYKAYEAIHGKRSRDWL